jgi:MFS family permease
MAELKTLISDSKAARWTALVVVAFTMFAGYYLADVMAPLKGLLENELTWSSSEYGFFTSAYGWFNVFLFFLIIGGIILDKMGVRFTGLGAAAVMVLGTAIKYWAISTSSLDGQMLFGWKAQVMVAALGFAIFGVGIEVAGITVSKIIVKWFRGKELALAMGLQLSIARLGTALALSTSLPVALQFGTVSAPILICLIMLCIGFIAFFVYTFMDKKLDASIIEKNIGLDLEPEVEFQMKDIWFIVKNKGWWYIAILCVLFYSAVFPFLKYATDLMINKFNVDAYWAGVIPGLLPFGTILLTPIFGTIYDRKGKGATIMIIGSFLITLVHFLFSVPLFNHWIFAIFLVLVLGIGFSLVPSAMWPSVPKIIPERQLGTAFALIFWVQNWGLMGVPLLIGWVLDTYCITGTVVIDGVTSTTYDYTIPMMIFTGFGLLAILFGFLLKIEDKKKGYGLQSPNIQAYKKSIINVS